MAIAQFRALNAFRSASGRSLRAKELVIRASDESAIGFIGIVSAVGKTIATPPVWKTKSIVTPELTAVTRREICTTTHKNSFHKKTKENRKKLLLTISPVKHQQL